MLARTPHDRSTENPLMHNTDTQGSKHLLAIRGDHARIEGKFQIADSLEIQCEIGGELDVGGKLVIGERGVVKADVRTVDAVIMGSYEGNMVASGDVEIASTGKVMGNIKTDSLVIHKGGFFNGNVSKIKEGSDAVTATPRPIAVEKKDESPDEGDKELAIPKLQRP
ncbi:MAG TPA: polymer-forming cytoskeletal protein [Longimicrobiales bacterium]